MSIDGTILPLTRTQWEEGTFDYDNVAENFHITDAQFNAQLYQPMRRGKSMRIIYGGGAG